MKHLYLFVLLTSFISCQMEDPLEEEFSTRSLSASESTSISSPQYATAANIGAVRIGNSCPDIKAYEVANMRDAFMSLYWRRYINPADGRINAIAGELLSMSAYDINFTHYYVKISPSDLEELRRLENRSDLFLSPIPFDREIMGTGTLPQQAASFNPQTNETILNDEIKPRYGIVPMNQALPSNCQILNYLYIPQLTNKALALAAQTKVVSKTLSDLLVDQALFMCGARTVEELLHEKGWNPSGRIEMYESSYMSYIGLPNTRVHAFNATEHGTALTDKDGYFTMAKQFKGPVNYYIEWGTDNYYILDDAMEQAYYYCGSNFNGPLHLKIKGGAMENIATITRALAAHYTEDNYWGRVSEYSNKRLEIRYRHDTPPESWYATFIYWIQPNEYFLIYGLKSKTDNDIQLFTDHFMMFNTFHELGHAAMYFAITKAGRKFTDYELKILESWGQFVGWYMLNQENKRVHNIQYDRIAEEVDKTGNIHYFNNPNSFNRQSFTTTSENQDYSPLFIDLIDDSNQKYFFMLNDENHENEHANNIYPEDNIVIINYDLLRRIAYDSRTVAELKANLLDSAKSLGTTEQEINEYFEFYTINN